MKKRVFLVFVLLFLPIVGFMAVASAEDSSSSLIAVSPERLVFTFKEGEYPSSKNLTFVGLSEGPLYVRLSPTVLYSNKSQDVVKIFGINPGSFQLSLAADRTVTIVIDASEARAGTYQGALIATAFTPDNLTTTNIEIIANIEKEAPFLSETQLVTILMFLVPIGIALVWDDKWDEKLKFSTFSFICLLLALYIAAIVYLFFKPTVTAFTVFGTFTISDILVISMGLSLLLFTIAGRKWKLFDKPLRLKKVHVVVFLALFVASVIIYATVNSVFGDLTILSGALITPFFAHVIGYVKDKRDSDKETKKNAIKLYHGGIETALNFLTNLLGETGSHYASLTSKNYVPNGTLKRAKWDESSTKGLLPDVPLGLLSKYYRFVDLHNIYYSVALKIQEAIKEKPPSQDNVYQKPELKPICDAIIKDFKSFREKYSELEQIIFAYLTYAKWLLGEEYLQPLDIPLEVPSRGLLIHLVDRGVLKPDDFYINIKDDTKYTDVQKFKHDINALNDSLIMQIKGFIYAPANRSAIKREITYCFDSIYNNLDKLGKSLPPIHPDLKDKPSTSKELKISGTVKTE